MDECTVELGQAIKVELIESFVGSEAGAAQPRGELLLLTPCNLVLDEQGQELGVGELGVDGLTVACFEGIEDAGQAQLLQVGSELRDRVHSISGDFTIIESSPVTTTGVGRMRHDDQCRVSSSVSNRVLASRAKRALRP